MVEPVYRIHDWVLTVAENKLYRQGREMNLEPRLVNLLRFLADHPGTVFGRDELIETVWEGAVVTDQVVTQSIFELRKILKDGDGGAPDFIATVPKRGYKLVAPVARIEQESPEVSLPEPEEPEPQTPPPFPAGPLTRALTTRARQAHDQRGRWRLLSFDLFAVVVLIALVSTLTWQQSKPHVQAVLDPGLVIFRLHGASGDSRDDRLAEGITRGLMREVAAATNLRVQLDQAGLAGGILPGREVSLRITRQHGGSYLDIEYRNRGAGRVVMSRQYQLADHRIAQTLQTSGRDLLDALGQGAHPVGVGWPSQQESMLALLEASHYLNSDAPARVSTGIALLDKALVAEPDQPLLLAERYLAGEVRLALVGHEAGEEEGAELDELARRLQRVVSPSRTSEQPARVWEALALHAVLIGDQQAAVDDLARVSSLGRSALFYILSGKLAELRGEAEAAGDAYAQAFLMEASEQTYLLCQHLGFTSNLELLAPYLYRSMTPSEVTLFSSL
ncbi:lysine decarboxylation/transport transcriptional activator CadC [Aeromonas sp. R6-2]|uniref:lysine decarboxylation/transport transcriptional activator CadC n=1 Tax=unclassified Aeromonas TaxID=257493 RepID=UPI0034A142CB